MYYAGCRIHMPVTDETFEEGDTVTKAVLDANAQTDEDIKNMTSHGTLLTKEQWEEKEAQKPKLEREKEIAALKARIKALQEQDDTAKEGEDEDNS